MADGDQDPGNGQVQYDTIMFPGGRQGYVPQGYGAQAQAMINRMGGGGGGGSNGGGAGTIGTFADGFEAVQTMLGASDMQGDLDEANGLLTRLDSERDLYAAQLDAGSTPSLGKTVGQRWKGIQQLQDRRDFLQERIISTQIRMNYGSGLAAAGRVVGRLMPGGGQMAGGSGPGNSDVLLAAGGLGLGLLLLRDRNGNSGSGGTSGPVNYGTV